jgi:hypothetical protein
MQKRMSKLLEAALNYHNMGLSVIPLSPGAKIPPKGFDVIKYRNILASEEEIKAWWKENPRYNIGIITGKLSDIFVVDLDKHDPAYSEDIALEYFPETDICPVVSTPKGGQHLYYKYPEDENLTIGSRVFPGIDFRGEGGYVVAPPSVNGNGKGYSWVIPFERATLARLQRRALNKISKSTLYRECSKSVVNENSDTTKDYIDYKILQKGNRDSDLFTIANALIKSRINVNIARQVIEILANNCNPPFSESDANAKIESAIQRVKSKERNLAAEIREWITLQEGYFNTTELLQTLQITTPQEKKNLTVILTRLNQEGIIEKYGQRRGQYITIQKQEENIIDLSTVDNSTVNIKIPLGIHELVKIMPKNIIIIAGESNAGKSAFLLNLAAKNMIDHKVFYFSSEMGGTELKERLQNFTERLPMNMWSNCTFIERSNDFDLAIRPDDINIIDFLEIHDEFYKIGGYIKKIFDKLNKGIAVIAIQKNIGRDEGLGGARSIEKARLYLSMSPGIIKIVKAKNWQSGLMNPNGLQKEFKLAKGMIFKEMSNWVKADDSKESF